MDDSAYIDREQTQVKHKVLDRYLSAFVPIVGTWAKEIAYVDCLAGPWNSIDSNLRDTSFSRAIEVMRSCRAVLQGRNKLPKMRCLLIERDKTAFARLKEFADHVSDIEVSTQNWDLTEKVRDVAGLVSGRSTFPFFFIDPKGWDILQPSFLRPLLALNPGEVLITFMSSWITRFVNVDRKGFDQIFGDDLQSLRRLQGEELEEAAVSSYTKQLRIAGNFNYACALPILKPNQDAFHFFMIYCTRHIRGVEEFKRTEKSIIPYMHETRANAQERRRFAESGQYELLEAGAHYKESKFTRFQLRQLRLARMELQSQLESHHSISYDDAWASAMQHSAVMESDLLEWISEWTSAKIVRVTNLSAQNKRPKRNSDQRLELISKFTTR